jgi:carbonic anhydrase/acetyltransferase-like protein (isoleucine patch superfamily)
VVTRAFRLLSLVAILLLSATVLRAQTHSSRTYFNQDIFVAQGQQIHNATCIFCSVQVEGDLTGRVFVLFGNLNVTGRIQGKAVVIGGNAVIDSQARIGGNALIVGGNAVYETDESISGNAWVVGGHLSPVGGHPRLTHRASFSPVTLSSAALAVFLLLSVLLFPRRRADTA